MILMRRFVGISVAVAYGLSFVAVCLATCLMPVAADHACCATGDSIRAADQDCCSITPGVSHGTDSAAPQAKTVPPSTVETMASIPLLHESADVRASASPPLVLRI